MNRHHFATRATHMSKSATGKSKLGGLKTTTLPSYQGCHGLGRMKTLKVRKENMVFIQKNAQFSQLSRHGY